MLGDGDRPAGIGRGIVGWYEDTCCILSDVFSDGRWEGDSKYKGRKHKHGGRRFYTAGGGSATTYMWANGRTGSGGLGPLPVFICHLAPPSCVSDQIGGDDPSANRAESWAETQGQVTALRAPTSDD